MEDKEIRDAIKLFESVNCGIDRIPALEPLVDLATAYLNVEGLPEKNTLSVEAQSNLQNKELIDICVKERDEVIDLFKVVIARDYVKRSKFKSLQKLYKRVDKSSNIMARQISLMSDGVPYDEAIADQYCEVED